MTAKNNDDSANWRILAVIVWKYYYFTSGRERTGQGSSFERSGLWCVSSSVSLANWPGTHSYANNKCNEPSSVGCRKHAAAAAASNSP